MNAYKQKSSLNNFYTDLTTFWENVEFDVDRVFNDLKTFLSEPRKKVFVRFNEFEYEKFYEKNGFEPEEDIFGTYYREPEKYFLNSSANEWKEAILKVVPSNLSKNYREMQEEENAREYLTEFIMDYEQEEIKAYIQQLFMNNPNKFFRYDKSAFPSKKTYSGF